MVTRFMDTADIRRHALPSAVVVSNVATQRSSSGPAAWQERISDACWPGLARPRQERHAARCPFFDQ